MSSLLAYARFLSAAALVGCLVVLSTPAFAQQQDTLVDPEARVVNEHTLLQQAPRIQGQINQLDQRERVLIQPAGRVWDYFHQVVLRWIGAIAIVGTLAALAAGYFLLGRLRISAGRSGRKVPRYKPFERFAHWLTAVSFVVLGLTGLNITFRQSAAAAADRTGCLQRVLASLQVCPQFSELRIRPRFGDDHRDLPEGQHSR